MKTSKQQHLKNMGIDVWCRKGLNKSNSKNAPISETDFEPEIENDSAFDFAAHVKKVAKMPLDKLEKTVSGCVLCALHKSRTQTVFGVGNINADVMFIGEAPGANEDLQGEPFVGKAGMLLNEMLRSIGLQRTDVYIANILKCRPPNNRDPAGPEVKMCTPYLQRQIALIKPKMLVAVGRIAAQFLLNTTESMARLRGRNYSYGENQTPLLITYHPAYLLRSPGEKSKAYLDFLTIQRMLQKITKK